MKNDQGSLKPVEHKYHSHVNEADLNFSMNGIQMVIKWIGLVPDNVVWSYSKHVHTSMELHIISKGECWVYVNDKEPLLVKQGQLFIVPPGVWHAQQSNPNNPALEYSINCSITLDQAYTGKPNPEEVNYITHIQNRNEIFVADDKFEVYKYFESLFQEEKNKNIGYQSIIQLLSYQIVINSVRAVMDKNVDLAPFNEADIDQVRMEKIDQIISERLSDNLSLKDISEQMYLSERQISRTVLNARERSLHQYILELKCEKAMVYLGDPRKRVQEVADLLGFSSSQHFSRFFQKKYGLLPSDYQRAQLEKKLI